MQQQVKMAFCRFGLLRSCNSLHISTPSLAGLRQNCPNRYVTTQSESEIKHSCAGTQHLIKSNQEMTNNVQISAQRPPFGILDSFVLQSKISPSSSISKDIHKYICPSRLSHADVNIVILDNIASITSFYDCPVSTVIDNMRAPSKQKSEVLEGPGKSSPKMEAKIIMRIRHKKMKKHKLKKLRKRMYFLWSRQKKARKSRRMKIYRAELEEIKASGDKFDAVSFVQEQIAKAKKGGYGINVLDPKTGH